MRGDSDEYRVQDGGRLMYECKVICIGQRARDARVWRRSIDWLRSASGERSTYDARTTEEQQESTQR